MYVMFYVPLKLFAKIHNIRETILSHLYSYLVYLHEDEENPADFLSGEDQMKGKGQKAQVQMVQMVQTVHMV